MRVLAEVHEKGQTGHGSIGPTGPRSPSDSKFTTVSYNRRRRRNRNRNRRDRNTTDDATWRGKPETSRQQEHRQQQQQEQQREQGVNHAKPRNDKRTRRRLHKIRHAKSFGLIQRILLDHLEQCRKNAIDIIGPRSTEESVERYENIVAERSQLVITSITHDSELYDTLFGEEFQTESLLKKEDAPWCDDDVLIDCANDIDVIPVYATLAAALYRLQDGAVDHRFVPPQRLESVYVASFKEYGEPGEVRWWIRPREYLP